MTVQNQGSIEINGTIETVESGLTIIQDSTYPNKYIVTDASWNDNQYRGYFLDINGAKDHPICGNDTSTLIAANFGDLSGSDRYIFDIKTTLVNSDSNAYWLDLDYTNLFLVNVVLAPNPELNTAGYFV